MTIALLHLSDIHIKGSNDWVLGQSFNIASCMFPILNTAEAVFVVVSGDVAYSGMANEYEAAKSFLKAIEKTIQEEKDLPVHFIIAPGNHDCDFQKSKNNNARSITINGVRSTPMDIDESIIRIGCEIQEAYFDFVSELTGDHGAEGDQLWKTYRFKIGGEEIVFDSLNVSWCSQLAEEQGPMIFPHNRYAHKAEESQELRISVLHHPLNWFSQATYHQFWVQINIFQKFRQNRSRWSGIRRLPLPY